jgi:hypothetical protein
MHLAYAFSLGNRMTHLNNKKKRKNNNNHHLIATAATISILAIAIVMVAVYSPVLFL